MITEHEETSFLCDEKTIVTILSIVQYRVTENKIRQVESACNSNPKSYN